MGYSRYASTGKGLSDRATRSYASSVARKYGSSSKQFRDVTTFIDPFTGQRFAKGSFQIIGHTAASLGFGSFSFNPSSPFTYQQQFIMYGEKEGLNIPAILKTPQRAMEVTARQQAAVASRGMVGEQTVSHSPTGFGHALAGGMGRGEWERPQKPKEETTSGSSVGTVAVFGGAAYLLWSLLK